MWLYKKFRKKKLWYKITNKSDVVISYVTLFRWHGHYPINVTTYIRKKKKKKEGGMQCNAVTNHMWHCYYLYKEFKQKWEKEKKKKKKD